MFYEVFIPSNGSDGFDVTITVEADNWMTALKSGLERTGQGADAIRNVMCDIKEDNTIHVTDASTARVFVLREVAEDETPGGQHEIPADEIEELSVVSEVTDAEDDDLDDPNFATQKMEPIKPLTGKSPVLKSKSDDLNSYQSREATLPRHRQTAPPPSAPPPGAPPPEATGKFERAPTGPSGPPPRATPQTGTHAPPPGAAPPPVARQSGSNPAVDPATASPNATTMPLTPTSAPPTQNASAAPTQNPPPAAQTPPPARAPEPQPAAAPEPQPAAAAQPAYTPVEEEVSDPIEDIPLEGGLEERSWTSDDGRMRIGSATFEALKRDEPEPKVVFETRAPSGQRKAIDIGRASESVSQNALEEVFLEINQIHEGEMSMEQVINYVMDLSMSKIRAEAGSIMFADVNGRELYFATARGPKAQEVMDFRVPMTKGLAGFCAREGVSLAISDAEKDPRFFKEISVKLGYETRNICCAPIQFEGRVYGAIELMNKTQPFTNTEVNVLTYIGRQLAKFVNDLIMAREKI